VIYLLDVLFNFHIGIVLTKSLHSRLVLDGALVARLYVKHSTFLVDFIAAIPLPLEVSDGEPLCHVMCCSAYQMLCRSGEPASVCMQVALLLIK
jgi:hypothetical protein